MNKIKIKNIAKNCTENIFGIYKLSKDNESNFYMALNSHVS